VPRDRPHRPQLQQQRRPGDGRDSADPARTEPWWRTRLPGPRNRSRDDGEAQPQVAVVHRFCPPITSDYCVGTLALQTVAARHQHAIAIAQIQFTLTPGRLGDFTIPLPSAVASLVFSRHHLRVLATVTAHDGAQPPRNKQTQEILLLVPPPTARAGAPPVFMP
jgi:hypothetical protein